VPDDPCKTCLCDRGIAVACAVKQCAQPDCDHWQRIEGECCTVKCMSPNNSIHLTPFTGTSGMYVLCLVFNIFIFVSLR